MELNELYTDIITEYAADKGHWHPLENADVTMRGVNPSCGDEISLELEIKDRIIRKVGLTGSGCAISSASASVLADMMEGMELEEAKRLARLFLSMIRGDLQSEEELEPLEDAAAFRGISKMPARTKCAVLAWHTLEEAIKKWQSDQADGSRDEMDTTPR